MTLTIDQHIEVAFGLQCVLCKHRELAYGGGCTAFPDGIPLMIVRDEFDHRLPFAGDNGIRFEPMEAILLDMMREDSVAVAS